MKAKPDSDSLGNTDSLIRKPLKTLADLRKYIERPRVVEVRPQMPKMMAFRGRK